MLLDRITKVRCAVLELMQEYAAAAYSGQVDPSVSFSPQAPKLSGLGWCGRRGWPVSSPAAHSWEGRRSSSDAREGTAQASTEGKRESNRREKGTDAGERRAIAQ